MGQNIAHSVEEKISEATFAQLQEGINLWIENIKETCEYIHQMIENYPSFEQNDKFSSVFLAIVKVQTIDQDVCSYITSCTTGIPSLLNDDK